jgi:hypothetical protein
MLSQSNLHTLYGEEMTAFATSKFDVKAFHEFCIDNDTFQRGYWVKFDPTEASSKKYLEQLAWGGTYESIQILSPCGFGSKTVWSLLAVVTNPVCDNARAA